MKSILRKIKISRKKPLKEGARALLPISILLSHINVIQFAQFLKELTWRYSLHTSLRIKIRLNSDWKATILYSNVYIYCKIYCICSNKVLAVYKKTKGLKWQSIGADKSIRNIWKHYKKRNSNNLRIILKCSKNKKGKWLIHGNII